MAVSGSSRVSVVARNGHPISRSLDELAGTASYDGLNIITAGGGAAVTVGDLKAGKVPDGHTIPQPSTATSHAAADLNDHFAISGDDTPAWLPAGAVAFADFANGHYYAGGQIVTVADFLDGIGTEAEVQAATGLVGLGNPGRPTLKGAFKSALLDWPITIVAAFDCTSSGSTFADIILFRPGTPDRLANLTTNESYITTDGFDTLYLDVVDEAGVTGKVAGTLSTAKLAVSANGGDVSADTNQTLGLDPATDFGIIYLNVATGDIISLFGVYPAVADADLPALSSD